MITWKIVGKEVLDYPGKDGKQVRGVRLHYIFESNKKGLEGICAGTDYFSDRFDAYESALPLAVGDNVNVFYNQWGHVEAFQVVLPSPAPAVPADKK